MKFRPDSGSEIQNQLYTCYEADETVNATEASPASYSADEDDNKHPNEIARNIQKKLQSVVAECVIEQCNYDEPALEVSVFLEEYRRIFLIAF